MKKILDLATISLRENISQNMLGVNILYLLFILFFLFFVSDLPDEYGKYEFFIDGAGFITQLFVLFFVIVGTFSLFDSDKNHNRLFVLLSSHFSRREYLLGKYLGAFLSVFTNYVILCLILSVISYISFSRHPLYLWGIYGSGLLEMAVFVAFAFVFSIFLARFMGLIMFFTMYIVGHFTYYLKYYVGSEKTFFANLVSAIYSILPNFEYFSLRNTYLSARALPEGYFFFLLLYTVGWLVLLFIIAEFNFSRRDF